MGISSTQLGSDSGFARRLTILATTMMMFVVLAASPASAWTAGECTFSGNNQFLYGNLARASTYDNNGQCDGLWAKVLYKDDGIWYWSSSEYSTSNLARKNQLGADDADQGRHKAFSYSGVPSSWKTSY